MADMVRKTLVKAPENYSQAKNNALIRDGYRCVVAGRYDNSSVKAVRELQDLFLSDPEAEPLAATQCAYIFSQPTNSFVETVSDERAYAATMWSIMKGFDYENLPDELNGNKIHRLENVMTLEPTVHDLFDDLSIWFTATPEVNRYKLEAANAFDLAGYPEYVTFKTPDPVELPVPSPAYLAIHAACAKIAHYSGAAE